MVVRCFCTYIPIYAFLFKSVSPYTKINLAKKPARQIKNVNLDLIYIYLHGFCKFASLEMEKFVRV